MDKDARLEADERLIAGLADRLHEALVKRVSIAPVSIAFPGLSVDDAYAVQMRNVERSLAAGALISGKKIGLTSLAMQELLGVDEPDYGHLFDSMEVSGGAIERSTMLQPRVEAEVAFILKDDLTGPGLSAADVLAATECLVGALEIVDSRISDWKITLVDTVADNASSGRYVLGSKRLAPGEIDHIAEGMRLFRNDELQNSGSGKAVLGDPAYCVAWLANKLSAYGVGLHKGEVVLSGALSAMVEARAGDVFRADFDSLGSVSVAFE